MNDYDQVWMIPLGFPYIAALSLTAASAIAGMAPSPGRRDESTTTLVVSKRSPRPRRRHRSLPFSAKHQLICSL